LRLDQYILVDVYNRVSVDHLIRVQYRSGYFSRAGSLGTGLPHAIKDAEITTVFPRPLKEFEDVSAHKSSYHGSNSPHYPQGTISDETNATIMNMYEEGNHAQDASKDSLHALRVKSLALLERSSRLSTVPESGECRSLPPSPPIDVTSACGRTYKLLLARVQGNRYCPYEDLSNFATHPFRDGH
jgi:hypothetical protein